MDRYKPKRKIKEEYKDITAFYMMTFTIYTSIPELFFYIKTKKELQLQMTIYRILYETKNKNKNEVLARKFFLRFISTFTTFYKMRIMGLT